jgi:hypothetical protein
MGCCESEEETQTLVDKRGRPQSGRRPPSPMNVQDRDDSVITDYSVPVLPIISPLPVQDRTLNSFLAQSIPGSLQEASFIAPTALEEDMERYEAVVNKALKVTVLLHFVLIV